MRKVTRGMKISGGAIIVKKKLFDVWWIGSSTHHQSMIACFAHKSITVGYKICGCACGKYSFVNNTYQVINDLEIYKISYKNRGALVAIFELNYRNETISIWTEECVKTINLYEFTD